MGVVVRRYIIDILIIIITFPYSTCIHSFFGSIIPISLFIKKKSFLCVMYKIVFHVAVNTYVPIFRGLDAHGSRKLRRDSHTRVRGTTAVTIIIISIQVLSDCYVLF